MSGKRERAHAGDTVASERGEMGGKGVCLQSPSPRVKPPHPAAWRSFRRYAISPAMKTLRLALLAAVLALPAPVFAADVRIEDAWARASLGQARNGAAYMIVHATGAQPDRIVAASSPVAGKVELHNHIMDGNVAQMRAVDAVEVTPGSPTVLQPGGLHVMLLDLTGPLQAGRKFPLTLRFERAGEVQVEVDIRPVRAGQPPAPAHGHGGGHTHRN